MKKRNQLFCVLCVLALLFSCVACATTEPGTSEPDASVESGGEVTTSAADETSSTSMDASVDDAESTIEATGDSTTGSQAGSTTKTTKNTTKKGNTTTQKPVWGVRTTSATTATIPSVVDMKGATLTIGAKGETSYGNGELGESEAGDKWIAWRKNFEKTYNCKLENVVVSSYNMYDTLATKLMSGDKVADIITMQLFDVEGFRHAGLLQSLQSIPTLNLEHPAVVQDMVDRFTYNGNSYLLGYGTYNEVAALYFNRDLIKELKLTDPYTLVKQKKWTWKAFSDMCMAAYKDNGDNTINVGDRFGAFIDTEIFGAALNVSDIKVISYNNGKFEYTFNTPKTLSYMTQMKDTVNNGKAVLSTKMMQSGRAPAKFAKGGLLFYSGATNIMGNEEHAFWDCEFELGCVPVPTFEEGMGYANSGSTWLGGLAVPKNTNQNDYIGYLLNGILDMEASFKDETKKNYIRYFGTEGYEIFASYNSVFKKDLYCWQKEFKDFYKQQFDDCMYDSSVTAKQLIEKIDSGMTNAVKDYYAKDPDLME